MRPVVPGLIVCSRTEASWRRDLADPLMLIPRLTLACAHCNTPRCAVCARAFFCAPQIPLSLWEYPPTTARPLGGVPMRLSRTYAHALRLVAIALFTAACLQSAAQGAPQEGPAPASLDELARQSLATIDGSMKVPGLKQSVEIIRDKQGIPHIFAKNQDDLFFAQGYVMAQ